MCFKTVFNLDYKLKVFFKSKSNETKVLDRNVKDSLRIDHFEARFT